MAVADGDRARSTDQAWRERPLRRAVAPRRPGSVRRHAPPSRTRARPARLRSFASPNFAGPRGAVIPVSLTGHLARDRRPAPLPGAPTLSTKRLRWRNSFAEPPAKLASLLLRNRRLSPHLDSITAPGPPLDAAVRTLV
jgi:hypothetical protein